MLGTAPRCHASLPLAAARLNAGLVPRQYGTCACGRGRRVQRVAVLLAALLATLAQAAFGVGVSTFSELQAALADASWSEIRITDDIDVTQTLVVARPDVTLVGACGASGDEMCTLDGMEARRVLQVTASSGTFTARNLEITRGKVVSTSSGEANGARGGGVLVSGTGDTIFEHCVLTRNVAMTSIVRTLTLDNVVEQLRQTPKNAKY